ncbi:MAG: hypothetical protein WBO09_19630 [Methylocystis silviterrae]
MKSNEIAKCFGVSPCAFTRRLATIDPVLDIQRPFLGVSPAQKCLVDISLATNLGAPGAGFEPLNVAMTCALSVLSQWHRSPRVHFILGLDTTLFATFRHCAYGALDLSQEKLFRPADYTARERRAGAILVLHFFFDMHHVQSEDDFDPEEQTEYEKYFREKWTRKFC